jgi:hypothetical protein
VTRRRPLLIGLGGALTVAAGAVELGRTGSAVEALKALIAAAIAVGVLWLALSLPGITVRGATIGGLFTAAGIFTWTFTNRPGIIWAVLAAEVVIFAVWSWPWLPRVRELPRLGTAWLGLAYWFCGILGALLVGHLGVAAQRIGYAGVFTLAVLAVLASAKPGEGRRDISVGIAAAILVGVGVLLLVGSGTVFNTDHVVPPGNFSAQAMHDRFWGDLGLFYHPNSFAGLAIIAAIRIGPDRAFAAWQRLGVTLVAGFVLLLSDSRIGLVFACAAALIHAVMILRRRLPELPVWRRPWLAAATPFAVVALVLAISGSQGFFAQSRFQSTSPTSAPDVTSGRIDTWRQVATDWRHASLAEKAFGDARTSRAVVVRTNDGAPPGTPHAKLNTDNSAVGAFRRGGVVGALAFLLGVFLLLWHTGLARLVRRRAGPRRPGGWPAAWFILGALAVLPTIMTEDWMLGGTNGALWILLLAGEVRAVYRSAPEDGPDGSGGALDPAATPAGRARA